jgi:hypothetical protein
MKETTGKLLEKIEEEHDWRKGQTWGGRGTYLSSTDVCRVCGLHRQWETDPQNGVHDEYTFSDAAGNEIPLRWVATRKCLPE